MSKLTVAQLNEIVKDFTASARDLHDTDSYSAGYLGSLLVRIVAEMPAHKQKEIAHQLSTQFSQKETA